MTWLARNREWLARAERWRSIAPEPLRVRVWLRTHVAWDGYQGLTALEGALQTIVVRRETGMEPSDVFTGCTPVDIPIPIADTRIGGFQIACASWAIPQPGAVESLQMIRKRPRLETLALNRVQLSGGEHKILNVPVTTLVTNYLDVFVCGDRDKLRDLLTELVGIGRLVGAGIGAVLGAEVTPDPDDRSLVFEGRPQRAIPVVTDGGPFDVRQFAPGVEQREVATRAPYWTMRGMTLCLVPDIAIDDQHWNELPEIAA